MSAPESPVEPFKRAVTATVRAIAADSELTVSYGTEAIGGGGRTRLPMASRALAADEVAQVRGAGDALGLWIKHHDDGLHSRFEPQGVIPRAVFEAAEQARIESIGANKMIGVSQNLDATLIDRCRSRGYANIDEPSTTVLPEIIGLLVREKLTGKAPPEEASKMVDGLRKWVEELRIGGRAIAASLPGRAGGPFRILGRMNAWRLSEPPRKELKVDFVVRIEVIRQRRLLILVCGLFW